VGSGGACHQHNREHNDVLFTKPLKISRARQRTFEKTQFANEMTLAGFCQLETIMFDNDL
jgi:hypothetical protein